MIKSISYWSLTGASGECTIEEALVQTKENNFPGLELCIGQKGPITPQTTQKECEAIRQQVDASGVIVQTLASGMSWAVSPTSDDAKVRAQSIELHREALKRAAWLGCEAMLFVPGVVGGPIAGKNSVRYDHALDRARAAVKELLETAEQVGVDLCVENVWNGMFYSPVELAGFIDEFHSDRLGVYFDVGNVLGYHQYPPHWIEILGGRIKRIHIKDFKPGSGLGGFCDLGAGGVAWPETMAAIRSIGYDLTIVAEMGIDPFILPRTSVAMDAILKM